MSIVWMLVLILLVPICAIALIATMKPDRFSVTRSLRINAPGAAIYPHIADMRRFAAWSPWRDKDPAMTQTFSPVVDGVGAAMEWSGNSKVGQGRMEITEAVPSTRITYKLNFLKPFKAENMAAFTLQPEGDATVVTWTMTGPAPFVSKVMDTLMNMDKMIGRDFEAGLASLKATVEK